MLRKALKQVQLEAAILSIAHSRIWRVVQQPHWLTCRSYFFDIAIQIVRWLATFRSRVFTIAHHRRHYIIRRWPFRWGVRPWEKVPVPYCCLLRSHDYDAGLLKRGSQATYTIQVSDNENRFMPGQVALGRSDGAQTWWRYSRKVATDSGQRILRSRSCRIAIGEAVQGHLIFAVQG